MIKQEKGFDQVTGPDLQISGGPGHPDPEIRGSRAPKNFVFGPQFGLKISGARPPRAPPLYPPMLDQRCLLFSKNTQVEILCINIKL